MYSVNISIYKQFLLFTHAIDKLIKILVAFSLFHDILQNLVPIKIFIYHTNKNQ